MSKTLHRQDSNVKNMAYSEVPGEWRVAQPNTYKFFDNTWGYR